MLKRIISASAFSVSVYSSIACRHFMQTVTKQAKLLLSPFLQIMITHEHYTICVCHEFSPSIFTPGTCDVMLCVELNIMYV